MSTITIYTTNYCPYCVRAKDLLKRKGQSFTEISAEDDAVREAMIIKAGGQRTVPQIFINDQHIGGCDDLYALEKAGKLDALLASN
ncbi:MAG: glutaredoxin 3 [Pseudomonadota bacterium]